jgi:glycosyltransferase involved in cell wall biosynthesis
MQIKQFFRPLEAGFRLQPPQPAAPIQRDSHDIGDRRPAPASSLNVLFITRKWPPAIGGMETYSVELAKALAPLVDLSTIVLSGTERGPRLIPLFLFVLRTAWHLWTARGSYDVVHFGDMALFVLARWNRIVSTSTRNVVSLHGLDTVYHRRPGLVPWLYGRLMAWAAHSDCVDLYVANSRATKRALTASGIGPATVVPLGTRIDGTDRPKGVDRPDNYVLYLGRVMARKGPGWFAERVADALPDGIGFKVLGTVWEQAELAKIEASDRSEYLGVLDKAKERALCERAIAVVLPNRENRSGQDIEGFGLVAVEVAALGVPAVAANTEGLQDAVIDGVTGFLVEPGKEDAWIRKIQEIHAWSPAERRRFIDRSLETLDARFSWERVAREMVEIYATLHPPKSRLRP